MSENKTCPICGGYIGNAFLHATLTTTSTAPVPPIRFCPGHTATDAQLAGHFPIAGETGLEQLHIPAGTSIRLPDMDTLWEIVQTVANGNPLHEYAGRYYCNYCDERQSSLDLDQIISRMSIEEDYDNGMATFIHQFPHNPDCIVTKARELLKTRIKVAAVTAKMDGGGYCNAPLPKAGE